MASKTRHIEEWKRVLSIEGEAILSCRKKMDDAETQEAFESATESCIQAIEAGRKIVVIGVGKSGKIASKIAATLTSTGSPSIALHPTEALHGDLGLVSKGDVMLLLSHTGNTEEILKLIPALKSFETKRIGIGGNPSSRLAEECTIWLDASVEQEACPHNFAPTASSTLALAIGDALALTIFKARGLGVDALAPLHPGGALGKRLSVKVSELYHSKNVGSVGEDSDLSAVVDQATRFKLGGVLVVNGKKLIGLITDGDLRRALTHRELFFTMKAKEIMTRDPVTVTPETQAQDALDLMRNRSSQISVLPVTESGTGHWKGILRLHDLVREL